MIDLQKIKTSKPLSELLRFSIINLDKPTGPTSFDVSHYIKNLLGVNKTSHFGTLDPAVTGVLPVGLGRACRLSDYFMHRNKTYVGIMRLHEEVSDVKLHEAIKKFIGKISQMPPVKSRVKRALREREIVSFETLEREGKDILFQTEVQAGTYIRKLCDDMGKDIGGAHMLELRRIRAGIFEDETSHSLYELESAVSEWKKGNEQPLRNLLIPAEIIATVLPVINIHKQVLKKCLSGSPIFPTFLENLRDIASLKKEDKFCIFCGEQFVGCYNYIGSDNLVAKPEFIFN